MKILRKNQNSFWKNQSTISNSDNQIIKEVHIKNLKATLLFIDFSKAFDSIHRGKTEQILLANGFSKKKKKTTKKKKITTIMMQ